MRLFSTSRRIYNAASQANGVDWSKTLHLPKSSFPARPYAAKLQEYRQRCADDLYAWQRTNRPSTVARKDNEEQDNEFILHDGPPYANGAVHIGHALNKILKDMILRSELQRGKRVHYRPGWDCHGLPIELKALQQRDAPAKQAKALKDAPQAEAAAVAAGASMGDGEIRLKAYELASRTIEEQKKEFREWAVMGEWDTPYKTMDKGYEVRQLEVFWKMVQHDLISRDERPVYWSPSSRTALAEAELEYDDKHKCTAAFVKMPMVVLPNIIRQQENLSRQNVYALIWTTTPWTLPANKAVAVKDDMHYSLVKILDSSGNATDGLCVIGRERIAHVQSFLPEGWSIETIVDKISGSELVADGAKCLNYFSGEFSPVLKADFVTDASGTGLVHIAPGHGMEDYQLCLQESIATFAPVDDLGRFTTEAFPAANQNDTLIGLNVLGKGAQKVLEILSTPLDVSYLDRDIPPGGLILATHEFVHKNPIDWRTKKPVIIRSTPQWFADVSFIRDDSISAINDVSFIPESGRNRLSAFIRGRDRWCISRQRAWGVPIPVIYHKGTDNELYSDEVVEHIISVVKERGTNAWFTDALDDPAWFPPSLNPEEWTRKRDTMDVWFDSGTSWTSLPERNGRQVSDVCVEGSDQHRGWFQSSLLTAIAVKSPELGSRAPYKKLITHGFTLDGEGRKMSKSLGNVVSPSAVISGSLPSKGAASPTSSKKRKQDPLGSDLLRLWAASSDYTKDVSVSQPAILAVQQALQKYRVTFRFLLGVLQDSIAEQRFTAEGLLEAGTLSDKMLLAKLQQRSALIFDAYREYRFYEGVREMNSFINADLSALYFEAIKDTMYAGLPADRTRVHSILLIVVQELLHWLAPVVPQLVEEAREHLPEHLKRKDSHFEEHPHRTTWREPFAPLAGDALDQLIRDTAFFEPLSKAVKTAQERARQDGKLGSGLACRVELYYSRQGDELGVFHREEWLRAALVVSELNIKRSAPSDTVEAVAGRDGSTAWHYDETATISLNGNTNTEDVLVRVLPPTKEKCIRCWQYTADEADAICGRCEEAVKQ